MLARSIVGCGQNFILPDALVDHFRLLGHCTLNKYSKEAEHRSGVRVG
jgi:hypothetical protein